MKPAQAVILTIIGISGDLSQRLLLPALYHLEQDELLPEDFTVLGVSRQQIQLAGLRSRVEHFITQCPDGCDQSSLDRFFKRFHIVQADSSTNDGCETVKSQLVSIENRLNACAKRLFYMAIPPRALEATLKCLGETGTDSCNHGTSGRFLIEKPFGHDLQSAEKLIALIEQFFTEEQIYRIDHFLAKETVQNILYFRFHNPLVRDIWNSKFIDHVQITASESIDIQNRADFYEQTGLVRDMIQSHLLQLVALTTMADPTSMDSAHVRNSRENVLANLRPYTADDVAKYVVRGQYEGYRDAVNNPHSRIETFAAMRIFIDNDRWRDVPIYIRSGKALERKITEITLVYSDEPKEHTTNYLTLRIQPNEGIALKLLAKKPGFGNEKEEVVMDYCYEQPEALSHSAYEKLLVDAMNGDQSLFPSSGEVVTNWRFIQPILDAWSTSDKHPTSYKKGSWGPESSSQLLHEEHIDWVAETNNVCVPRYSRQ